MYTECLQLHDRIFVTADGRGENPGNVLKLGDIPETDSQNGCLPQKKRQKSLRGLAETQKIYRRDDFFEQRNKNTDWYFDCSVCRGGGCTAEFFGVNFGFFD